MLRGLRQLLVVLVVLLAGVAFVACGADGEAGTSATTAVADAGALPIDEAVDRRGASSVSIDVADNVFEPRVVRIDPGATVTWTNTGYNSHNVTPVEEGSFEPVPTASLEPKASASRTFSSPGVYRYFCSIHGTATRGQRGVIVVGDAGL